MKLVKKFWWVPVGLLVAMVLVMVTRASHPEPMHDGRSFSSWFHEAETDPYLIANGPPVQAIRAMGAEAVPLLAARVRHPDSALVQYYWRRYPNPSPWMRRWLPERRRPGARQEFAAMMLYEIGEASRPAVPELIPAYDQAYLKHYGLGGSSVDWAREFTNTPTVTPSPTIPKPETLRLWILMALTRCGDESKQTIPLIFTATHDADTIIRQQAFSWLTNGTNLAKAIGLAEPFASNMLTNQDPRVRIAAAKVLARLPVGHPDIIAPLLKAAEDPDQEVRLAAYRALQAAKPDLQAVVPVLGRLVSTNTGFEHGQILRIMSKSVGPANLFPALTQLLDNTNPQVRIGAAQCLAVYGSAVQAVVPRLQQLTNTASEPDESVRRAAGESLSRIAPPKASP